MIWKLNPIFFELIHISLLKCKIHVYSKMRRILADFITWSSRSSVSEEQL
jgi:hypothetical protein